MNISITDHSDEAIAAKNAAVRKFLEEAGLHLEGQAKKELENDPRRVDTGLLRNSITHALAGEGAAIASYSADKGDGSGTYSGNTPEERKGQDAVYVGTNVEYAPYVHYGTRKMAPNAFLKNAFQKNASQLQRKFREAMEGK